MSPVAADHPQFNPPSDPDAPLWRYMSFSKFVSLLDRGALFFCRADKLGDPFEGSYPVKNKEMRPIWEAEQGLPQGFLGQSAEYYALQRQWTFVNGWHMNEVESDAMWHRYSQAGAGVALRSTYNRLRRAFAAAEQEVFLGVVRYLNYETACFREGNALSPFVHKRSIFRHEYEFRALVQDHRYADAIAARTGKWRRVEGAELVSEEGSLPKFAGGKTIDWEDLDLDEALPLPPPGIYVRVDLDDLIEAIFVAPDAEPWFRDLVESVMKRYGFERPVIAESTIAGIPFY
jgi:hypothetical protein